MRKERKNRSNDS